MTQMECINLVVTSEKDRHEPNTNPTYAYLKWNDGCTLLSSHHSRLRHVYSVKCEIDQMCIRVFWPHIMRHSSILYISSFASSSSPFLWSLRENHLANSGCTCLLWSRNTCIISDRLGEPSSLSLWFIFMIWHKEKFTLFKRKVCQINLCSNVL